MSFTFEVAIDSIESGLTAQSHGANRVELCADLGIGGITPSHGMMMVAKQRLHIPINAIIRPRRGDFLYTEAEFEIMQRDIDYAKSISLNGVVFGILTADGQVDIDRTRVLTELARPLSVTFHRAFDMTSDPEQALNTLLHLGVDTVLTSGQQPTAQQGLDLIAKLVKQAQGRIDIMPGAGIQPENIREIVEKSGATSFHFSGKHTIDSGMTYRNPNLSMGGQDDTSEYRLSYADGDTIQAIIKNAGTSH